MAQKAFAPGERIGPYTLLGKIARGGMGEIYRAQDPRLGREVAIKFLIADSDEQSLLRFEQEARAVAALAHPHVVTVFDLGRHERHPYIVSELLQGQTLRDLLGNGLLPRAQAVPLTLQLLSGLDAAHSRGIIHRDLKPENLFLTDLGVLKILDFGIAKVSAGGGPIPLVRTRTGAVMGTIGYCSPEQLEARPIDVRTDIFSVGVVLHELLLGQHPLSGKTRVEMADAMLNSDLPPLPDFVPPALAEVVRICEARDREHRFSSVRELTAAIEAATGGPAMTAAVGAAPAPGAARPWSTMETLRSNPAGTGSSAGTATAPPRADSFSSDPTVASQPGVPAGAAPLPSGAAIPPGAAASPGAALPPAAAGSARSPGRRAVLAAVALLVLGAAAWTVARRGRGAPSSSSASRPSVAVLPPQGLAGDLAWMGGAAASLVEANLGAGGQVRVARPEAVALALAEPGLRAAEGPGAEAVARAGALLGVARLVTCALSPQAAGGGVQLELRLWDAQGGKPLATVSEGGAADDLAALAEKAGGPLRASLGAGPLAGPDRAEARAALPSAPAALQSYALGEQRLRRFELGEARAQLEAAVAAAPALAPGHALLAEALEASGDREGARAALQRAVGHGAGLGRELRLRLEARLRVAERDFPKAAEAWGALAAAFPDEPDYPLEQARALGAAGRTAPALALLEGAAAARPDPRAALASGDVRAAAGDLPAALADWQRAAEAAKAAGASLLQAAALLRQAQARAGAGPLEAALAPAQESLRLYTAARHLTGALAASQALGGLLRGTGDVPAELARAEECAALAARTGAGLLQARCAREQVQALVLACDGQRALAADAAFRQLSASSGLDGAEVVEQPGVLARFAAGRFAEAEAQLAAAEPRAQRLPDRAGLVRLLLGPGDAFAPEPSAAAAEARVQRALALAGPLGQELLAAQARLALARVDLALGRPPARELAAASASAFEKQGAPAWEAQARATLARALLAAKADDEAAAEAARAAALADRSRWRGAQLAAAGALVAVHAAAGKRFALLEDARKLERLRDDAARAGCVAERLGAEGAIARALRAADPAKAGAGPFAEARKLGYVDLGREEKARP